MVILLSMVILNNNNMDILINSMAILIKKITPLNMDNINNNQIINLTIRINIMDKIRINTLK